MPKATTELSNVIYNATTQMFEALVRVRDGVTARSYACAIEGPISLSFERAADSLAQQALRRHSSRDHGLGSFMSLAPIPVQQTNSHPPIRRGLPLGQYGYFRGRAA